MSSVNTTSNSNEHQKLMVGAALGTVGPMLVLFGAMAPDNLVGLAFFGLVGGAIAARRVWLGSIAGLVAVFGSVIALIFLASMGDSWPKIVWVGTMMVGAAPGVLAYILIDDRVRALD